MANNIDKHNTNITEKSKKNKKTTYKCTCEAMCNELRKVYVMALCPIMLCALQHIYNCVGLYRHTQVYIYIIYNNNIYFYALL